MKRTLNVTLVVGGLLLAILATGLISRQQILVLQDARAAEERAASLRRENGQPQFAQGEEEVIAPPANSDERTIRSGDSVVEVELVFFGDKSRRAVSGLVFDSNAEWSLIAVNATATRVPADLPPAIDQIWVNDRSGRRWSAEHIGYERGSHATIYQVKAPLRAAEVVEPRSKLSKGGTLTALEPRLDRSPQTVQFQTVQVVGVLSEQETSEWRLQAERGKFETPVPELIEFTTTKPLRPGTPLFRDDECVGLVLDTAELKGPEPNRAFATRTAPIQRNVQLFRQIASRRKPVSSTSDEAVLSPQATPASEAAVKEAAELKVFHLQNVDAAETLRVIQPLLPREAKVSADQRTNSLIVSATANRLAVITALLIALDEAPTKKRLPPPTQIELRSNSSTPNRPVKIAAPKNDQDAAMDREAKQLAARVRAAKEPEKSKLRAELELLTDRHFEHRQQRRQQEIDDMADRVDKLQVALHQRQENKPDIIKRRLADLLDEENELKWDDSLVKPSSVVKTTPKPSVPPQLPNLDGEWLVTLPAGFEFVGKIEKRPEGCWMFEGMRNLSGCYQLDGTTLKGVTIDQKEPREYGWLILSDNVMVLTNAPQNIGSDYRGATLQRGAKPKKPAERTVPLHNDDWPSSRTDNGDPRRAAILAAHRKAAEARLHLAKFELDNALKTVQSVPGSISATELEKLKTNVAVAEAELELVIAGGDPHASKERGVPLSEPVAAAKLAKAEALLNSAKQEFDRLKKLEDRKAVSRAEVERASAAVEEAKANVDIAKAELEVASKVGLSQEQ